MYCENCSKKLPDYLDRVCSLECLSKLIPYSSRQEIRNMVYLYILEFTNTYGYTPTLRNVAAGVFSSISNVRYHVSTLERYGLLRYDENKQLVIPGSKLQLPAELQKLINENTIPFTI